jgi:two-component system response regulator PhoP
MGHQVDDAEDAKEADYYLNEHLPDIAIVDLGLPDEDGLSLFAAGAATMSPCRFWC